MRVTQLELKNFRNIASAAVEPCDGVNLIWGDNAQGKTNLLESIWLFTGCRSFRGAKAATKTCFCRLKRRGGLPKTASSSRRPPR